MSGAYRLCLLLLAQTRDRQQRDFGAPDLCQANQNNDAFIQHKLYQNKRKYVVSNPKLLPFINYLYQFC